VARRKNPSKRRKPIDPIGLAIDFFRDRLKAPQEIQLPRTMGGVDAFLRQEGVFALRRQASKYEQDTAADLRTAAINRGKAKALNALGDFIEAFSVSITPEKPKEPKESDDLAQKIKQAQPPKPEEPVIDV